MLISRCMELGTPSILSEPQFAQADVLVVAAISSGQLKGILDRKQVILVTDHNPGSGRRRMFTGSDILRISTANAVSRIGFPLRWVHLVADHVEQRAVRLLNGTTAHEPSGEQSLAFFQIDGGDDVQSVRIFDGKPEAPLPVAVQVLAVDRLINETIAKLQAVVADQPSPNFEVPPTKRKPGATST
jgi:hypothetical protein